jgi:hypothetical protein
MGRRLISFGRILMARTTIIPPVKKIRGNAAPEKNEKKHVAHGRPPRALFDLPGRRARHRRVEQGDPAGTPEAQGKFHVFHQGDGSESAEGHEAFAPDENALVAVERAEGAGMPALDPFGPKQERMAFIELAVERAALNGRVPQDPGKSLEMSTGELGIDVMKKKNLPEGARSSVVQLLPTPRPRGGADFNVPVAGRD